MKAVGARLPRYDGVAHVTGRTVFVDDVRVPGTLWAKALRSPVAPRRHHAASTRPGPRRWRASTPSSPGRTCRCTSTATSPRSASRPTSRCSPRTTCATRASRSRSSPPRTRTPRTRPSRRSSSSYEEQPALFDVRKAFDADAPQIHHWGNWYPHFEGEMDRRQIRKGDIERAFDAGGHDRRRASTGPPRSSTCRSRRRSARSSPRRTAG